MTEVNAPGKDEGGWGGGLSFYEKTAKTLRRHCLPSYITKLSSKKFLWLQVLVGTHQLPKPSFSLFTTRMVINLLN